MKIKFIVKLFVIIVVLEAGILLYFKIHDALLVNSFSNNLFNHPLPPNTEVLEKTVTTCPNIDLRFGNFGNGEYTVIVATMKLKSLADAETIKKFYNGLKLPLAGSNVVTSDSYSEFTLLFENKYIKRNDSGLIYYERVENKNYKKPTISKNTIYVIQIISGY